MIQHFQEFRRIELDEMIVSKDKKIFTLENHINELEDEIRRLQYSLNEVIETGEQIKQLSYEKIEQFKTIEAHRNKYLFLLTYINKLTPQTKFAIYVPLISPSL